MFKINSVTITWSITFPTENVMYIKNLDINITTKTGIYDRSLTKIVVFEKRELINNIIIFYWLRGSIFNLIELPEIGRKKRVLYNYFYFVRVVNRKVITYNRLIFNYTLYFIINCLMEAVFKQQCVPLIRNRRAYRDNIVKNMYSFSSTSSEDFFNEIFRW